MRWVVALLLAAALAVAGALWLLRTERDVTAAPDAAQVAPAPKQVSSLAPVEPEVAAPQSRVEVEPEEDGGEELVEVDEPPEEGLEEPFPPDPVELGPARLDLRLLDARTNEPVASHVELWRIDAPGNESWTGGDQLQQQAHVPVEGFVFTRLPQGRYRLVCHAQAWDAAPPEVDVVAPLTRLDVPIEVPATFEVRVVVRDRFGRLVPEVFLAEEQTEGLSSHEPWRFERTLRSGDTIWFDEEIMQDATFLESREGPQTEEGYGLGLHGGATRGAPRVRVMMLQTPERGQARVRVPARAEGDLRFVAVVVPPEDVAARVFLPDGAPVTAAVEVWGEAIEADPTLPGGGWDRAPVRIRVRLDGYQPASLSWSATQGDLPRIVLERDG